MQGQEREAGHATKPGRESNCKFKDYIAHLLTTWLPDMLEYNILTRIALTRVHTSAKAQESPLISSSRIQYQIWIPTRS